MPNCGQFNRARFDSVLNHLCNTKKTPIRSLRWNPPKDALLTRILKRSGYYYHSAELLYQEFWKQRLVNIGFRVLVVEKAPYHEVWRIRVCGNLTTQTYLLLMRPVPPKHAGAKDLLERQLRSEVQQMAKEMGPPIKRDCLQVVRTGAHLLVTFIWPM